MPVNSEAAFFANGSEGWSLADWLNSKHRDYLIFCGFSRVERICMVRQGLPATMLVKIASDMGVPSEELFRWLGIPKAIGDRKVRERASLSLGEGERAIGIARLIGKVTRVVHESGDLEGFDPARWTAAWLRRPSQSLGGHRPADYMDTADGRALVASLVAQMQSGAYA